MDYEMEDEELAGDEEDQEYDDDHSHFDNQRLKWIAEISEVTSNPHSQHSDPPRFT
jgi:hypothetical protein